MKLAPAIAAAIEAGQSVPEIAARLGRHPSTVYQISRKLGYSGMMLSAEEMAIIASRRPFRRKVAEKTAQLNAYLIAAVDRGETPKEMAAALNLSTAYIYGQLSGLGYVHRNLSTAERALIESRRAERRAKVAV